MNLCNYEAQRQIKQALTIEIPTSKRCAPLVPKLRLQEGGVFLESLAPVSVNSVANVITLNDSFLVAKKLNW